MEPDEEVVSHVVASKLVKLSPDCNGYEPLEMGDKVVVNWSKNIVPNTLYNGSVVKVENKPKFDILLESGTRDKNVERDKIFKICYNQVLNVGDQIAMRVKGKQLLWKGKITSYHENATYDILFENGVTNNQLLSADLIRIAPCPEDVQINIGAEVLAKWNKNLVPNSI